MKTGSNPPILKVLSENYDNKNNDVDRDYRVKENVAGTEKKRLMNFKKNTH